MDHQMTITLTDEEYAALATEAARSGKPIETIVRETLAPRLQSLTITQPDNDNEIAEYLYHLGITMNKPTGEPLTPEEVVERERLALKLAIGQPLSEIVIEDRGPRD